MAPPSPKARKALTERQQDLEMKTQQLEIKLSNKTEEDIKKARRKSTQAGEPSSVLAIPAQREGTGLPVRLPFQWRGPSHFPSSSLKCPLCLLPDPCPRISRKEEGSR